MSGLLLKDFYMIWKHFKAYFLIDVVFITISFYSDENILFLMIPIMLAGVIPITLLAYDERSHWTEYCGALPYSKAQIVSAKYLVGLIMQSATSIVILFALIIKASDVSIEMVTTVLAMFIMSLIFPSVCMPFSLKFGTEKGRIIYYVVIGAVAGVTTLTLQNADDIPRKLSESSWIAPAFLLGLTALYILSWLLSVILYNNKEAK